jgi:large subunit ribosomal protein L28
MSKACEVCGKSVSMGNRIVRHGLAKAKGGIGLHTTGISRRKFSPNLQKIRVLENGGVVRKTVCTACIRSEKITKG